MPLNWIVPRTDALFGPGYQLSVQSSLIGPFPSTYHWRVQVYSTDGLEAQLIDQQVEAFSTQQQLTMILADPKILQQDQRGSPVNVAPSSTVRLIVDLINEVGQRIDGDTRNVKWDPTGRLFVFNEEFAAAAAGGFTQEDRDKAVVTQMAVSIPLPGLSNLDQIASGITGFFTNPPGWAMQELDFIDIAGDGDLTRPGFGRGVNAYGAQAAFLEVPPQLGVEVGRPLVYLDRICKLTTVLTGLSQLEFYDRSAEFYFSDQRFMWGTPFPQRITYSVFPGCVVRLFWLHLAPNWWPFP